MNNEIVIYLITNPPAWEGIRTATITLLNETTGRTDWEMWVEAERDSKNVLVKIGWNGDDVSFYSEFDVATPEGLEAARREIEKHAIQCAYEYLSERKSLTFYHYWNAIKEDATLTPAERDCRFSCLRECFLANGQFVVFEYLYGKHKILDQYAFSVLPL